MKVLFVCPFVPWPLVNGGKIRTYHLLRAAARECEVHVRVIQEPEPVLDAAAALEEFAASVRFFERSRPGRIARWQLPKLERWFHSRALLEAVHADLASGDFKLVHLDELLLARIVPDGRTIPVVQHHHKLDTVLYESLSLRAGLEQRFDRWKLRRLEAESARRYRHHLLCSQDDADTLRARHGALDCAVVPSGFDPERFQLGPNAPPRAAARLLFLGSMDYGPNVEAVLRFARESLPAIRAARPETVFEIVGANPTAEVRALAGPGVLVTGRVDTVQPYLARASALVVPLAIGGGTRLKIVEALALSTPVVSTTIGAQGLGLVDGTHLALADGGEAFARATLALLADPAHAARLAARGRTWVDEHYRWSVLGRELVDYWERVAFSGALSPSH
ncbi:MAG: glycosyltransferase family 4 protein [Planctomycetota bacterium]